LINRVAEKIKPGGYFVITFWNFLSSPKLAEKFKPLTESRSDLYRLGWGAGEDGSDEKLRLVKAYSESEIQEITNRAQLKKVNQYKADGRNGKLNQYLILEK
jgi:hypothetical protein